MRCTVPVVVIVVGAGMLLVGGCRDRASEGSRGETAGTGSPPPPPSSAQELLREVSMRAKGRVVQELTLHYVRPDGQMDPTYGELRGEIGDVPPPPPADDPNRPVGAPPAPRPITAVAPACVRLAWRPGGMVSEEEKPFCMPSFGTPIVHQAWRCSVAQLWERARKDGAPEGLAVLAWKEKVGIDGDGNAAARAVWKFSINDEPRGISFNEEYLDDCAPVVERAPS